MTVLTSSPDDVDQLCGSNSASLQFSTETVQRQFSVADGGRLKPVPDDTGLSGLYAAKLL